MYWVYAIYNRENRKIYIGQTEDLEERLKLHNSGIFRRSYTARLGGNWELIYKEKANDRKSVLKREKELKSYQGRLFIKNYIPR